MSALKMTAADYHLCKCFLIPRLLKIILLISLNVNEIAVFYYYYFVVTFSNQVIH